MENNSIYTIPVTDIFQEKCSCPFCRLYEALETRSIEYITGAAMMEPDIRIKTNQMGFCNKHLSKMLLGKNKLPVALTLQTHLEYVRDNVFKQSILSSKTGNSKKADLINKSCYVCNKIDDAFLKIAENSIKLFFEDSNFQEMYFEQEYICLNHYNMLSDLSKKVLKSKEADIFMKHTAKLCKNYLDTLIDDVTHFTKMFDYRNAGGDWKNAKDSLERAVKFLTSEDVR